MLKIMLADSVKLKAKIYDGKYIKSAEGRPITGKIILYKNKPEIVITNPNQISEVVAVPLVK